VQQIIEREIAQMNGRAEKLFICGVGIGGHIALLSSFYSQHIFGGVFCLDIPAPDELVNAIQSREGAAIFPQYEAKKNMFICMTEFKKSLDADCKTKMQ
jgi:hypothetical protein